MRRRRCWMPAPDTASPPRTTLKPLNSGGLCEPVTWTPPSTLSTWVAKYSAGVGSSPTSTPWPPTASIPESRPCASAGPEGRLSRPTASRGARPRRSHPSVATACPMARATSAVSWLPTVPRISYSRKMAPGTFIGGLPALATGRRRRGGGDRRHGAQPVAARFREVEQAVWANAEHEQAGDRHRHHGATQPTDAHARVGLLERLGLHVHRHNHREIVACRDHARKDENRGERELPREVVDPHVALPIPPLGGQECEGGERRQRVGDQIKDEGRRAGARPRGDGDE